LYIYINNNNNNKLVIYYCNAWGKMSSFFLIKKGIHRYKYIF